MDNICTIQKVTLKKETERSKEKNPKKTPAFEMVPGFQIVTIAGGMNFTFKTEKERDEKFNELLKKTQGFVMKVKNKWNSKIYEVVKEEGVMVTLKREDGSMFIITKSEFHSAYNKLNN